MPDSLEEFQQLRKGSSNLTKIFLVLAIAAAGIWWQFIRLPQNVEITKMVPGMNAGMSGLECWITLNFKNEPAGDPRDLVLVFEGEAIAGGQQRFDWDYIASHDMTASGKRGHNGTTKPGSAPPVGKATRVNFPLRAKSKVEDAAYNMPLVATVYWGGVKQDQMQKSVGHTYRHENSAL